MDLDQLLLLRTYVHTQLEPDWLLHMYLCTYVLYVYMYECMYECMYVCMYDLYVCMYVRMYVCMYVGGCCYIMRLKSIMESMQPLHLPSVELQDNQKITKRPLGENTMLHHKEKGFKALGRSQQHLHRNHFSDEWPLISREVMCGARGVV